MRKGLHFVYSVAIVLLSFSYANAGEIETNVRIEHSGLNNPNARLVVLYDKYSSLPFNIPGPIKLISSEGLIEFGYDESKKIFHADNLTSVLSITYVTRNLNLVSSSHTENLIITYNKQGKYTAQNFLSLSNVSYIDVFSISIHTYKNYGPSQIIVPNPKDIYLEASIKANEASFYNVSSFLLAPAQIKCNPITVGLSSAIREIEPCWDYIPGAEEYELEYIYIDNYDATTLPLSLLSVKANSLINYDFDHDATRVITSNQYYRIPLIYEKGIIIFRVRGVGVSTESIDPVSLTNNYARLEGAWSNVGTGSVDAFRSAFPNQYYEIQNAHEQDQINWSSLRTFAEDGKSGMGISYVDGVLQNRQNLAKLNTEDKIIAQANLYDWQGRPAISVLPSPINQNYFEYIQDLNLASIGGQFDKNIFDNLSLNTAGPCSPNGLSMDPVGSKGAANYYSANNADKEGQQALVPDAQGFPFTQIDYYPDQTGRVKRQSLSGPTHYLSSGKEHQFFYAQPTQEELVRLFGTEVGTYDKYEKRIEIDPNGQTSVSYVDDEGRTIATGLSGANPANLIAIDDAINSATAQSLVTTLSNNNNDPQNYTFELTNSFYAALGETQTIDYNVAVPVYSNGCAPALCLDCIYELEISLTDDCQNELLDGNTTLTGNQPINTILGRYDPTANPSVNTSCPSNTSLLSFSLSTPTSFSFNVPKAGTYHLVKKLKLSTAPIQQYAEEFVSQDTCLFTLEDFQQTNISAIDILGCESLNCASCSTSVMNVISGLPVGSFTQSQIDELIAKCELKCDLQNPCSAKEKLMLMSFKPNGYFGKYDGSYNSNDALSIFNTNPSTSLLHNTLHGTLNIQPSGSNIYSFSTPPGSYPSGYEVFDPVTTTQVTPDHLSAANYIGSFTDAYSEPWLKWHPEYCKLKYECDAFVNALKQYSRQIEEVLSYDEACRKGLLTPLFSMNSYDNAPLAASCVSCSVAPIYEPFVAYPSGTTFFNSAQILAAKNTLGTSLQSITYSNNFTPINSLTGNIYQFAMACARNTEITNIIGQPVTFGDDDCTKDREWLFFKQFYLIYKDQLLQNLKSSFIIDFQSDPNNGGCLTDFSVLPGFVKVFPDNPINDVGSVMATYNAASTNPTASASIPNAQVTAQCASYCQSYVATWLQDLSACFTTITPAPAIWANIQTDLLAVCNGGCDSQDPFGASTVTTPPSITISVNGNPHDGSSFDKVIAAYKAENLIISNDPNCTGYAISFPKPKGNSVTGTSETVPKLDDCGCNTILDIHAAYLAAVAANSALACTKSESEFAYDNYGIALAYWGDYVCGCQKAFKPATATTPATYDFTQLNDLEKQTLILPENMACKNCINCKVLDRIWGAEFIKAFPFEAPQTIASTIATVDHDVLTNWINNITNMNNTYDQWLAFNNDCKEINPYNVGNTSQQTHDLLGLFQSMYVNQFFIPNTAANPHVLTPANSPALFNSTLWSNNNLSLGVPPSVDAIVTVSGNTYTLVLTSMTPAYNLTLTLNQIPVGILNTSASQVVFNEIYAYCESSSQIPGEQRKFKCLIKHLDASNNSVSITSLGIISSTCTNSFSTFTPTNNLPPHVEANSCPAYLCRNTLEPEENDCMQSLINSALNTAQTQYQTYYTQQVNQFIADYKNYCYANVTEEITRGYTINEYQYTLYYYDRAGNLVHTVPPKGVDVIINPIDIATAVNYVNTGTGTPFYPKHSINPSNPTSPTQPIDPNIDGINRYITNYEYNTYNSPLVEVTPDGGETRYFYDYVGRLAVSQDAKHRDGGNYSYTLYDEFGRITEVGSFNVTYGAGALFTEEILKNPATWNTFINSHFRYEVTQTFYDVPLNTVSNGLFPGGHQQNLRGRISATTFEKNHDTDNNTYDYATFYSYDDHGNVDHLVQDNPSLTYAGAVNQYKYIDYEYDLISGNVKKVIYQKNKPDQYYHKYEYDKENRLHEVYTSNNDIVYTRDAKYFYYQHGPLARVETGEHQVQGTDYAYTLQGWIKGINSNILSETTDIGKDGNKNNDYLSSNNGIHQNFGRDASSYSLNYYTGDYNPIKAASQNFLASMTNLNSSGTGVGFNKGADAPDLYNGNIASMVTSIYDIIPLSQDFGIAKPQFTAYRYDQLQRIKQMKAYNSLLINAAPADINEAIDLSSNSWLTPTAQNYVGNYEMSFEYDKNGNIEKLNRKGDAALVGNVWTTKDMDQLTYTYKTTAGISIPSLNKTIEVNNQLRQVIDGITATNYGTDIDNQTDPDNYKYNPNGSLEQDVSEEIERIEWTSNRKIKSIERTTGSFKSDLYFEYNEFGQRISKTVVPRPTGVPDLNLAKTTYYVLDAGGNQLAIYNDEAPQSAGGARTFKCDEHMLFGSARLGVDNTETDMLVLSASTNKIEGVYGAKDYENNNHLGNVITTINDRKIQVQGTTTGLFNDFEIPFNWRDNTNPNSTSFTCKLFSPTQAFGPALRTLVYPGDIITAEIKSYYVDPAPLGSASPGMLVLTFADGNGNFLYDATGATQWFPQGANTNNLWQTLTVNHTVPPILYSNPNQTMVYYGNIYANSYAWNPNQNFIWFDNQSLVVNPINTIVGYYNSEIKSTADYYPFGAPMPGRSFTSSDDYRYNFNGKEEDQEIVATAGGIQDYGFRMYNPSLGRFLSVDPLTEKFPELTPYQFASDRPIDGIDLDGLENMSYIYLETDKGKTLLETVDFTKTKTGHGTRGNGVEIIVINTDRAIASNSFASYSEDGKQIVKEYTQSTLQDQIKEINKQKSTLENRERKIDEELVDLEHEYQLISSSMKPMGGDPRSGTDMARMIIQAQISIKQRDLEAEKKQTKSTTQHTKNAIRSIEKIRTKIKEQRKKASPVNKVKSPAIKKHKKRKTKRARF